MICRKMYKKQFNNLNTNNNKNNKIKNQFNKIKYKILIQFYKNKYNSNQFSSQHK